jgi:hypothetical protein
MTAHLAVLELHALDDASLLEGLSYAELPRSGSRELGWTLRVAC